MSLRSCFAIAVASCLCAAGFAQTPVRSRHVVVVMEENRSVSQASEYMPYLNSLAQQYSQGMQVYSDSHGSWLAYGELTSGMAPLGGEAVGQVCSGDGCSQTITINNLVRQFASQGVSWRGYFQGLPQTGYLGYQYGMYVRRHNPFAFYSDVVNNSAEQQNIVPLETSLLADIANNKLANFNWITPDLNHDAHDGSSDSTALAAADAYLQTFVPQLLQSAPFQPGGDGVLVVTFDEGELAGDNACGGASDPNNCGGHIWQVVIGPQVKRGFQSNSVYKQGSQLRMFCDLLGLTSCPGDGANAPSASEFFQPPAAVTIASPVAGATVSSPFNVVASGTGASGAVNHLELWIDGQKIDNYSGSTMNANVAVAAGTHDLTVVEVDSTGAYVKSAPVSFTVKQLAPANGCVGPSSPGVNVCSPTPGQILTSSVTFVATGTGASGEVNHLELWIDGGKIGNYAGASMNAAVTVPAGTHSATVVEVDSQLHYVKSNPVSFTVPQKVASCAAPSSPGAVLCTPAAGASMSSSVQFTGAGAGASGSVNHLELWIDGSKIGDYPGSTINTQISLPVGTHAATLVEVDSQLRYVKSNPVAFTVK